MILTKWNNVYCTLHFNHPNQKEVEEMSEIQASIDNYGSGYDENGYGEGRCSIHIYWGFIADHPTDAIPGSGFATTNKHFYSRLKFYHNIRRTG